MSLDIYRRIKKDKMALFGLIIILAVILMAILAPFLAPYDLMAYDLPNRLQPPSEEHPLGTDEFGRDLLSRLIWAPRISLPAGLLPVLIGLFFGSIFGLISGYTGGFVDEVIMSITDILLSIPYFLLALVTVAILGPGLTNGMIALSIGLFPSFIRLTRGSVLSTKEEPFILAAKAIGCSRIRVMFTHLLPNVTTPLIVYSTLKIGEAILAIAALGFLGLGAQPPTPEWGLMLNSARQYLFVSPHLTLYPCATMVIVVLAFNLFGDGLRDILDPRYRI